ILLAEPIIAMLLFLIGRRLFDDRVALLAAATYALFPFTVLSSTTIHMEPFATLSACLVAYLLLRHLQSTDGQPADRWGSLLAAGMFITLGIYTRESVLPVGAGAFLTLFLLSWRTPVLLLRRLAVLLAGVLIPCVAISLSCCGSLSVAAW